MSQRRTNCWIQTRSPTKEKDKRRVSDQTSLLGGTLTSLWVVMCQHLQLLHPFFPVLPLSVGLGQSGAQLLQLVLGSLASPLALHPTRLQALQFGCQILPLFLQQGFGFFQRLARLKDLIYSLFFLQSPLKLNLSFNRDLVNTALMINE